MTSITWLLAVFLLHAKPSLHSVLAQKNDTPEAILKRYLIFNDCNLAFFLKENKLNDKAKLKGGVAYNLPVWIYVFNGKNIRSSIKNDNFAIAKQIEQYNKRILHEKKRSKSYIESKKI